MAGGEKTVNVSEVLSSIKSSIRSEKELDYFLTHQERYRFILERVVRQFLPGSRVLDVGCYPLHIFTALEKLGYEVFGISSKHESVKRSNIATFNIETDEIKLPGDGFDLILMTEIVEHLVIDPRVYLAKIKKLLKPGGILLITTPNGVHLKNRAKVVLGRSASFPLDHLYQSQANDESVYFRHNREFTLSELQRMAGDTGLKVKAAGFFSAYSPFRQKLIAEAPLVKFIKTIGYAITLLIPSTKDSLYLEVIDGEKL